MDLSQEERQRREFRDILFSLSESQEILREKQDRIKIYKRLEALYYSSQEDNAFRHFYSDIFSVLTTIKQGDKPGSIDILGQNLAVIRKGYQALNFDELGNKIDISDSLKKLYDHVSLDIARMGYSDAADRNLIQTSSIADIKAQVTEESSQVQQLSDTIKGISKDLESSKDAQKEYIAILGIFAAVVLAFTGGIAFSTSIFQNLHRSSIYRIVLLSLIIGLVLINILYGLFYYVDRLVNKKDKRKIKPLWITNLIFLLLICATVWSWYMGVAEKRNARIENVIVEEESFSESFSEDSINEGRQ